MEIHFASYKTGRRCKAQRERERLKVCNRPLIFASLHPFSHSLSLPLPPSQLSCSHSPFRQRRWKTERHLSESLQSGDPFIFLSVMLPPVASNNADTFSVCLFVCFVIRNFGPGIETKRGGKRARLPMDLKKGNFVSLFFLCFRFRFWIDVGVLLFCLILSLFSHSIFFLYLFFILVLSIFSVVFF